MRHSIANRLAERDRGGIDDAHHLLAFPTRAGVELARHQAEGIGEDGYRPAFVGIRQGRALEPDLRPQMIVMLGVGVPGFGQPTQPTSAGELGKDQRDQMLPALEALVVGVTVVALDDRLELPAVDRFEQLDKNAIREVHAPSLFLSLDNQKIDGKFPAGGACPCDFSIHLTSSPDSPARKGREDFLRLLVVPGAAVAFDEGDRGRRAPGAGGVGLRRLARALPGVARSGRSSAQAASTSSRRMNSVWLPRITSRSSRS